MNRRKAKSSKSSHVKENSLLLGKRFDFSMQDEDFEELQCGFVPKEINTDTKKCVKFLDWESAKNGHSCSLLTVCQRTFFSLMIMCCSHP